MKQFLILTICLFFFTNANSQQLFVSKQYEVSVNPQTFEVFELISLANKGTIVLEFLNGTNSVKDIVRTTKLDTALSQIWQTDYAVNEGLTYVKNFRNDHSIYHIFQVDQSSIIRLVIIDLHDGTSYISDIQTLTQMEISEFKIIGSKILIGGKYNDRAIVEIYNAIDKTSKILPGMYANDSRLLGIETNTQTNEIYTMIRDERLCKFTLHTFDSEGKPLRKKEIGEKFKKPIYGKILNTKNGDHFLIGSYADNCSTYAVGFFVHKIADENSTSTEYFDFLSLNNFLNYLPKKRQERITSRIKNKKTKGKDFKLRQRLLLHELQPTENGWNLIADVYYPEYNSQTNNFSYRSSRIDNFNYNQFKFSHAIICQFDSTGKMTWDASVDLNFLVTSGLLEVTQVSEHEQGLLVAFPKGEAIKTKVIKKDGEILSIEDAKLMIENSKKQNIETSISNFFAWYGHNFLAYGYERRIMVGSTIPQEIFYIKKLSYENELR